MTFKFGLGAAAPFLNRHSPEIRGAKFREFCKFAMTADESHSQPRSCYTLFGEFYYRAIASGFVDKN